MVPRRLRERPAGRLQHVRRDLSEPGAPPPHRPALRGELLEPGQTDRLRAAERRISFISRILDDLIEIPGTGRRIGVDPVLGLLPVVGDAASAFASFWIIAEAARFRLPPIVLGRMVINAVVDLLLGAIPLVGDLFDFVAKANARNLALFRRYATDPEASTSDQRAFFLGLMLVLVGLVWLMAQLVGWLFTLEIPAPTL